MILQTITIDRKNLTIAGVKFPDLATLDTTASSIGSNIFEGFRPTQNQIVIIRDYVLNKITLKEVVDFAK